MFKIHVKMKHKIKSTALLFFCIFGFLSCVQQPKKLTEKDMSAYLLVYFKEYGHHLYMALSSDGYTFTDVNNGDPVIRGDTIALQKGIRDPYIYRGPDNAFYLAMTDLHIYAQEEGYRETQWEREGYGWGNNRALVLMKSFDLINWTRANMRIDIAFPELEEISCAWAPGIIFDEEEGKIMVYFTMRVRNAPQRGGTVYIYLNDDFNQFLSPPKPLFESDSVRYIDSDITKIDNKFHMFIATSHGGRRTGIKQVISNHINRDYEYIPQFCDPEPGNCEGPNLWKRIGEDKWVLMYDVYSARPNNMGFSETSDFVNFTDLGHFNAGVMKTTNFTSPKHGAVIHLTAKEANRLAAHWGLNMRF